MTTMPSSEDLTEITADTVPSFGYELIREELLTDLLGKDTSDILYWAGKRLARKYPITSSEALGEFFQQAGWGNLSKLSENQKEIEFELTSSMITERCKKNAQATFQLEAGFIAQQIEQKKDVVCEAFEHPRKKGGKVLFTVKWDKKDAIV
ncbi:YslB family protein [Cytobacillus purgationiresistens]|uniref:Hydrocarbon binding protein n=1 Tax=Cytobacillus purgationiresistens TaxID=863449 RepID=A0ABU0AFK2_9BACI|nr:YslB family protein [Cytobacillus purgationiresistens]MDQ0270043.1 putative hydrocarbon binding protein [Cytobacillus purgationiresistens]